MAGDAEAANTSAPLVIGYDGRDESSRALEFGLEEARKRGAPVVIVVVAGIPYETVDPYEPGMVDIGLVMPIPEEGPIEVQPHLERARERLSASGVEGTVEWALGDPASELIRIADERKAAAIVVGTHPHSAIGRFFGTDIAAELLRDAPCDVLVAR